MKVSKRLALGAAAAAAVSISIPTLANPNSPHDQGGPVKCNDGTITWTPKTLWPPNHKMIPVTITYTDNEGDASSTAMPETTMVSVGDVQETDGATTNDALVGDDLNGSGAPGTVQGPDAVTDTKTAATPGADGGDPATWTEDLRAERSGTDGHDGARVYTLQVTCSDSPAVDANDTDEATGQMQTVPITVTVPHDQGN